MHIFEIISSKHVIYIGSLIVIVIDRNTPMQLNGKFSTLGNLQA
jgi:hypothetical protein